MTITDYQDSVYDTGWTSGKIENAHQETVEYKENVRELKELIVLRRQARKELEHAIKMLVDEPDYANRAELCRRILR